MIEPEIEKWGNKDSPWYPSGHLSVTAVENVNHFECGICHYLFEDEWEYEEHMIDESRKQPDPYKDYDYYDVN